MRCAARADVINSLSIEAISRPNRVVVEGVNPIEAVLDEAVLDIVAPFSGPQRIAAS